MTITLPDDMRETLERAARAAGFASVDDYVAHVLRWDDADDLSDELPPPSPGASYVVNSREELEQKILDGLSSEESIPSTPEFWADMRRTVAERVAALKGRP